MGDVEALGPAQDGLPRPAQPRRHRRGGADHPRVRRGSTWRSLGPAARRSAHLRDARARRDARRVPVRVERHARRPAAGEADRVRRPHRARRALPARADGEHPGVREAQERARADHLRRPAPRADPALEQGVYIYQEQAMQIAKDLAGFSPAEADDLRKAIVEEDAARSWTPCARRFVAGCTERRRRTARSPSSLWHENERSADYSFNKVARGLLRADRLPHRVPQGATYPPAYMAALISSVMQTEGQGAVLRRRVRRDGHRGAAAGRQPLRSRASRSTRAGSASA